MKIYQKYLVNGQPATFRTLANSLNIDPKIEENTRIRWKGQYFIVHDINPRNHKYPVLIKNRDVKMKATVALINNAEIITYN